MNPVSPETRRVLRESLIDLRESQSIEAIAAWAASARIVLLGEASHGTREFYDVRARITRELIEHHGFSAIAVEGDWPDAYRVNRYVQGRVRSSADEALSDFKRFPQWMWRNTVVLDFITWLSERNAACPVEQRAGFYGLDLYNLHASMDAVVQYLERIDPEAARSARASYECFDHFGRNAENYAWTAKYFQGESCEDAVMKELLALREAQAEYLRRGGPEAEEEFFYAEQNARLAHNAEQYYRTMFRGHVTSWNLRDRHMAETLDALLVHLERRGKAPRIVVWAHNSHVGDARATELGERGELTLGQLAREFYGNDTRSLGFSTYNGTVTAASDWDGPAEYKRVRPALPDSYEEFFHELAAPQFFLPLRGPEVATRLPRSALERAIGVVYRPETERRSHYFRARLAEQFDAIIHLDETHALEPLERTPEYEASELPETFPSGI